MLGALCVPAERGRGHCSRMKRALPPVLTIAPTVPAFTVLSLPTLNPDWIGEGCTLAWAFSGPIYINVGEYRFARRG